VLVDSYNAIPETLVGHVFAQLTLAVDVCKLGEEALGGASDKIIVWRDNHIRDVPLPSIRFQREFVLHTANK